MLCEHSCFIECYSATKDHIDPVLFSQLPGWRGEGWCVCVCERERERHRERERERQGFKDQASTINAYGIRKQWVVGTGENVKIKPCFNKSGFQILNTFCRQSKAHVRAALRGGSAADASLREAGEGICATALISGGGWGHLCVCWCTEDGRRPGASLRVDWFPLRRGHSKQCVCLYQGADPRKKRAACCPSGLGRSIQQRWAGWRVSGAPRTALTRTSV